jgi:hypothetical protein
MRAGCVLYRRKVWASVVVVLCICVLSQMLGVPFTLVGLLTSSDMLVESASEDFSLTPVVPEAGISGSSRIHAEFRPSLHLPVFVTSVFHPPQT